MYALLPVIPLINIVLAVAILDSVGNVLIGLFKSFIMRIKYCSTSALITRNNMEQRSK